LEIIYTDHAEEEIEKRAMKKEDIEDTLNNPDIVLQGRGNKKIAFKKIGNRKIKVIYTLEGNKIIVITNYPVF